MPFFNRRVYMDYASATPVLPNALRAVTQAMSEFGNPGSIHGEGVAEKKALEAARESIASQLACKSREVVFVSGGTEANNLAILGFARKLESIKRTLVGTHWIVSAIEHPSVLECFAEVERMGGVVTHIQPDSRGRIGIETVQNALRKETVFVSIGWSNHEIGIVQDLADISRAIRSFEKENSVQIIFHSDAGQGPLYKAPHVHTLGVDIFSLDSGKLYGPRGIGAADLSNRTELARVMLGGGQERGLRAGTENVALAVGFATALETVSKERSSESRRIEGLRNDLAKKIVEGTPDVVLNGDLDFALQHMLNISIPNVDCEYLTLALDTRGIAVATKSACREGEESRSHVVSALTSSESGHHIWRAEHTMRISLGRDTRTSDIKYVAQTLTELVHLYRQKKMV